MRDIYVVVNETTQRVCTISLLDGRNFGSRSSAYRVKKYLQEKFPQCRYSVYKLVKVSR